VVLQSGCQVPFSWRKTPRRAAGMAYSPFNPFIGTPYIQRGYPKGSRLSRRIERSSFPANAPARLPCGSRLLSCDSRAACCCDLLPAALPTGSLRPVSCWASGRVICSRRKCFVIPDGRGRICVRNRRFQCRRRSPEQSKSRGTQSAAILC
jgi:hypothetical protein